MQIVARLSAPRATTPDLSLDIMPHIEFICMESAFSSKMLSSGKHDYPSPSYAE